MRGIVAWGDRDAGAAVLGPSHGWWRAMRRPAAEFNQAKGVAVAALALSLALWLIAFLDVGSEWFLMWQSRTWNGQEAAFRMFAVAGIVLLILLQPDADTQA